MAADRHYGSPAAFRRALTDKLRDLAEGAAALLARDLAVRETVDVDLVAIVSQATVEAEAQRAALDSEADRRGITLPTKFSVPDRELWEKGYAAEARRSLLDAALALNEALAVVAPFLNPLLDGSAAGVWEPEQGLWTS